MLARISRTTLLQTLMTNRKEHVKLYNEAVVKYVESLKETMELVRNKLLETDKLDLSPFHALSVPISYETNYDDAINMLQHTEENVIELSQTEFKNFVMDEWSWGRNFVTSNSRYLDGESLTKAAKYGK